MSLSKEVMPKSNNVLVGSAVCYQSPGCGPANPKFGRRQLSDLSGTSRGMSLESPEARYSSMCALRTRLVLDGQWQHT